MAALSVTTPPRHHVTRLLQSDQEADAVRERAVELVVLQSEDPAQNDRSTRDVSDK
jgi:hypothetical protein